jgi:hypothetical protein
MRLIPVLLLALAAALPAAADTVVLPAAADTTIYGNFDDSGNGLGQWIFTSMTNTGAIRRALIRFDFSRLPPGSVIQSVSLRLGLSRGGGSNPPSACTRSPRNGPKAARTPRARKARRISP